VPVAFAELLSRELRRISVDARDAASSAARRIEVALSVDGDEAGPLPAREAAAIQVALARPATSRAASAPVEALRDMLALEYGDHAST